MENKLTKKNVEELQNEFDYRRGPLKWKLHMKK